MDLKERADLIDRLESAIHYGESHIGRVPGLLKEIIDEDAWKKFETKKGTIVEHTDFEEFVTTKEPYRGLGAKMELIKGIASSDLELHKKVARALRKSRGGDHKSQDAKEKNQKGSLNLFDFEEDKKEEKKQKRYGKKILQLEKEAPELYAQVLRNEKTVNEAAIEAGIYPKQLTINLDNPQSAARTIREKASPEFLAELRRLLS